MMDLFTWSETCCNKTFRHIKSGHDWRLLSLRLVTIRTTRFDTKRFYLLPTKCIYVFCMELNTNSDIKLYNINWKLDISESRSEIPVKFWNAVLQKHRKDRWDRSCEKLSITEICWRKCRREDRRGGTMKKKTWAATARTEEKEKVLETDRESPRSSFVENSLWKRLWPCRKTDYPMIEY